MISFTKTFSICLLFFFFLFRATDADVGANAVLRYSLIGGNTQGHFVIDSLSGDVAVVQPLDYEAVRSYRLVIRAQGTVQRQHLIDGGLIYAPPQPLYVNMTASSLSRTLFGTSD